MSIATLPHSYLALLRRFPLHPIRSRAQYRQASEVLDSLVLRDDRSLDQGQRDYLETLELLIEDYDEQNLQWGLDRRSPTQRLSYLLDQSGMKRADLARLLDVSPALVSLMLSGKRELSKANIRRLCEHFHVDAGYFL
jgi:HTH-type transcriptional regulator/antitoxin HigA